MEVAQTLTLVDDILVCISSRLRKLSHLMLGQLILRKGLADDMRLSPMFSMVYLSPGFPDRGVASGGPLHRLEVVFAR